MATVTSMNVATAITKLVAVDVLPALVGELVMGNLVRRDFEPQVVQPGDQVDFLDRKVEMSQFIESTFQIPDVTKVLAIPDLLQLYMRPAVVALAEKIETDLHALRVRFSDVSDSESSIEQILDDVEVELFQVGIPAGKPKYLVTDAATYLRLRQLPRFSEFQSASDAGLRSLVDGSIGKIRDFYVFRSRHVDRGLAFTQDSMALVMRRITQPLPGTGAIAEYAEFGNFGIRVVCSYQPNTLAQQFTVGLLYGCQVMHEKHGVRFSNWRNK